MLTGEGLRRRLFFALGGEGEDDEDERLAVRFEVTGERLRLRGG